MILATAGTLLAKATLSRRGAKGIVLDPNHLKLYNK